jgi:demethylmenaquinone methyltransferase / 2-methoxy-6-polyprenyl-1,4-benzoquinol methylase
VLALKVVDYSRPEAENVQRMFSEIAFRYDFLNRLLSFGIDKLWRQEAVRRIAEGQPKRLLDVATGTADLAIALKRTLPDADIIGVDFAEPMLVIGRQKASQLGLELPLLQGDGMNLEYPDNSFDALSIAYGLRNFSDRQQGLSEFYRVLKPGGRLFVLEFPPPPKNWFGRLFRWYFLGISPYIAGVFSGRRDAYVYLGKTVLEFPTPDALAHMMMQAGFVNVQYRLQTYGVSALHIAQKQ